MPGHEIVAAIEHDVGASDERHEVRGADARRHRFDTHLRIHRGKPCLRGVDFAHADVGGGEQDLALQVRQVDRVGIAQRDRADPGRSEKLSGRCAQAAGADDERMCRGELFLRVDPELRQ